MKSNLVTIGLGSFEKKRSEVVLPDLKSRKNTNNKHLENFRKFNSNLITLS